MLHQCSQIALTLQLQWNPYWENQATINNTIDAIGITMFLLLLVPIRSY